MDADDRLLLGLAVGALGAVGAAAALVSVRGQLLNADVALVLVIVVLLGAVIGGRRAGAMSALVAAAAFDFFHTRPYNTLKISSRDDIITTGLILIVGLAAGELASRAQRIRA